MQETLPALVVLLMASLLSAAVGARFTQRERPFIALSFVAHIVAAIAQVLITRRLYGGGDMLNYFYYGSLLSRAMEFHFDSVAPEVFRLLLQSDPDLPFYVLGVGSSTGTMSAVMALLVYIEGESLYSACLTTAAFSFIGKVLLYATIRSYLPEKHWTTAAIATLLLPSVVFWSSGVLKESIAVGGLGFALHGLHLLGRRPSVGASVAVGFGISAVALTKPYILFPLVIAVGVWLYWQRAGAGVGGRVVRLRPAYLVTLVALAWGGVVALGRIFPQYSTDQFAEQTARLQAAGAVVGGGSYYEMGDAAERGLAGQLAFVPWALFTALFRPLFFEVRNVPMAVAAVESTLLTYLFIRSVVRNGWPWLLRSLGSSPTLAFSLAFALSMAAAVGLATTNMGTLSRYRMPLLPFFALTVLLWSLQSREEATARPVRVRGERA